MLTRSATRLAARLTDSPADRPVARPVARPAARPARNSTAKGKGKGRSGNHSNAVLCSSCKEPLFTDHSGIVCPQNHHLCPECAALFVTSSLSDGPVNFLKCSMKCGMNVVAETFERQLIGGQRETYLNYVAVNELKPHEKLQNCPSCDYFEVWPKIPSGMDVFICRKTECGKYSCSHCCHDIIPNSGNGYSDRNYQRAKRNANTFVYHMECAQLAPMYGKFQDAIEEGLGTRCPSCGIIGRKDENCTHITCLKCQCVYCYVCGLAEADCDKEDPHEDIHSHNEDWATNEKRCPMNLVEIGEVDDRWSLEDDSECLARMCRYKTLSLLSKVHEEIGPEIYERLRMKYEAVRNCGYSPEDFEELEEPLIRRLDEDDSDDDSDDEDASEDDSGDEDASMDEE
jgi:hypothetical protein